MGTVSFATGSTWTVGGRRWSDVVVLSSCASRTSFSGEVNNSGSITYLADGRNNPTWKGTLLSWAAVIRYQDQLCPNNWRVPTDSEFAALNSAVGSMVTPTGQSPHVVHWGAQLSGYCFSAGTLNFQGAQGRCWSATQGSAAGSAYHLNYSATNTGSTAADYKSYGYPLRCIEQN
jgi:uncharacterized protein (TIGR02145 family)